MKIWEVTAKHRAVTTVVANGLEVATIVLAQPRTATVNFGAMAALFDDGTSGEEVDLTMNQLWKIIGVWNRIVKEATRREPEVLPFPYEDWAEAGEPKEEEDDSVVPLHQAFEYLIKRWERQWLK